MTLNDTLYSAYRDSGRLKEAGRGLSASETSDGIFVFNRMVNSWRSQRLTVWAEHRQKFDLVSGQQEYKIGTDPSADWQVTMPTSITKAGFVFTSTNPEVEQPFDILTPQQWQALSPKNLESTNPYRLFFEQSTVAGAVSVMGTVFLWPVPVDASIQVALYPWMQLLEVTDPTQTIIFPPQYQEAVESNLAVLLAARDPKRSALAPSTQMLARSSFARLKAMNSVPLEMRVEAGCMQSESPGGGFNLFSNSYNNRVV